ncbi:MAG: hypothetical protein IJ944_01655 [Clostridia bacterium]|nr:hypothetical protein [Clostridia bacterium]
MKKYIKIIALVLCVFTLCTVLCSCDDLDEMQEAHGFWQEDGSILYKGNVYYKSQSQIDINFDVMGSKKLIVVTNEDVPVLLSEYLGTKFYITKDNDILYNGGWPYESGERYIIAEKYDQVISEYKSKTNNGYNSFSLISNDTKGNQVRIFCDSKESAAIKAVTSIKSNSDVSHSNSKRGFNLYLATSSGYFDEYCGVLTQYEDGRYVIDKGFDAYFVPKEYHEIIDSLYLRMLNETT